MDYSKHQYQILCEDKAHYHFVRGWLESKGGHRRVQLCGSLPHDGCGKDFVQKNFADALDKVRKLSNNASTFLIVVVDADNLDLTGMIKKFPCNDADPVFVVIAKWSIDTWVRFLMAPTHEKALDESASCKNEFRKSTRWATLGKKLASMPESQSMPESLRETIERVKNKKKLLRLK